MTSTYRNHVIRKVADDKYVVEGWDGHSGYVTETAARRGIDRALKPRYTAGGALKVAPMGVPTAPGGLR